MTLFHCRLNGKSCDLEWIREGHRNYPLIGRAPPYSALHILAEHASKAAAAENLQLPDPADTKRWRLLDEEFTTGKPIITDDPTLPPPSPAIFGISRKDLKKSLDMTSLHQSVRKKNYQHLKPPPPPNVKIQHLYQTLNAKRPRKSLTKKSSKARVTKQSPGRMHLPYPPDEKHFDGVELQRHLTSQLMPPPMSPVKSPYAPILPAGKKDMNLIKMNHHQSMEPQAHYIPNNPSRLKGDFMCEPTRGRSGRAKNVNMQQRSNYQQQKYANGAGARNNMDHIPDPQIIFNTTSSKMDQHTMDVLQMEHNNHDMDMSPQAMASPLQLLSTAASCTPKLKVTSPSVPHHQPSTSQPTQLSAQSAPKPMQNRSVKIVPVNSKPMIIKPADAIKSTQAIINNTTAQSAKFKIQKIQLVMNKNQDGTSTTASLSPSATIVSGKAGQLVFGGKGITNSYQIGGKSPYTIVSAPKASGPKVIVQAIDRSFTLKDSSESSIPENQRITENTPIDFLPSTTGTANYPKLLISKPQSVPPKQFKIKLGASIVNPKIIKGPIPANLKIQRNINTKGFTVVNSSQIVHLQAQTQAAQAATPTTSTEGTKVDWEQELDDVNRTKGGKSTGKSNGDGSAAKKMRLDDGEVVVEEVSLTENVIVETVEVTDPAAVVFGKFSCFSLQPNYFIAQLFLDNTSHVEVVTEQTQPNISELVSEYVFLNHDDEVASKPADELSSSLNATFNGEESVVDLNGQVESERQPQNGAEAYENLVKSLTECESDYMKDIADDPQMDENFGLIDNNILDSFGFTRESGLFQ